jgi:hypothetical protein
MIPLQMMSGRQKEHNIGLLKVQWLHNLSRVLLQVGSSENANLFIGCSEIENRGVLEDLIKESNFVNKEYGIIHFDSPDKRESTWLYYQNNISDQRRILIFR